MQLLWLEAWVDYVSGSSEIDINYESKSFKTSSMRLKRDIITIDGSTGRIIAGSVSTVSTSGDFSKLMSWADGFRKLKVRANSETPKRHQNSKRFPVQKVSDYVELNICFLMKDKFYLLRK